MSDIPHGRLDERPTLEAIKRLLSRINERLDEQEIRSENIENSTVSKAELRARRIQTAVVAFVVAALLLVLVLPPVLRHYQHSYNALVTRCFLTPEQTGDSSARCSKEFPGYAEARAQSKANLQDFQSLLANVPVNKQRIDGLERQVAALEAKQGVR